MASTAALYTPEVLALATSLADHPLDAALVLHGSARSVTCGSALEIGLTVDASGRIERLGLRAQACAIGQASAAIFIRQAKGRSRDEIASALAALQGWLTGTDPLPGWPGLGAVAAARDYPARHGAMQLAWKAALDALPSRENPR